MTAFSGLHAVNGFRIMTILNGLRLEIRCPGMRLTAKAPKCSTIVRREWGFKGRPEKLLEQLEEWVKVNMPTVETDRGAISLLHSNPLAVTGPILGFVQPDGTLSEQPAPLVKVRVFAMGSDCAQLYHIHSVDCPLVAHYGPGKLYNCPGDYKDYEVRSDEDLFEQMGFETAQEGFQDVAFGSCATDEGPCALPDDEGEPEEPNFYQPGSLLAN